MICDIFIDSTGEGSPPVMGIIKFNLICEFAFLLFRPSGAVLLLVRRTTKSQAI